MLKPIYSFSPPFLSHPPSFPISLPPHLFSGFLCVFQAGFEFVLLLPQPPKFLGFLLCATAKFNVLKPYSTCHTTVYHQGHCLPSAVQVEQGRISPFPCYILHPPRGQDNSGNQISFPWMRRVGGVSYWEPEFNFKLICSSLESPGEISKDQTI